MLVHYRVHQNFTDHHWCHICELDTVGGVGGVLTGDVCFVVLFSTGFFLVLLLFFWDFTSVAVEGVTGNFTGLEDWFEDLTTMQENNYIDLGQLKSVAPLPGPGKSRTLIEFCDFAVRFLFIVWLSVLSFIITIYTQNKEAKRKIV